MKYILVIIGAVLGCIVFSKTLESNGISEKHVKELQMQNDSLLNANKKYDAQNALLRNDIEKKGEEIQSLQHEDEALKSKVAEMNQKIKSLKSKYEKANNHADGFDSAKISVYFSNL